MHDRGHCISGHCTERRGVDGPHLIPHAPHGPADENGTPKPTANLQTPNLPSFNQLITRLDRRPTQAETIHACAAPRQKTLLRKCQAVANTRANGGEASKQQRLEASPAREFSEAVVHRPRESHREVWIHGLHQHRQYSCQVSGPPVARTTDCSCRPRVLRKGDIQFREISSRRSRLRTSWKTPTTCHSIGTSELRDT